MSADAQNMSNSSLAIDTIECEGLSWSESLRDNDASCNAEMYIGQACSQVLQEWHQCAIGTMDMITVGAMDVVDENDLAIILDFLQSQDTECQTSGSVFLCQYVYPLYECSSKRVLMASMEECIRISTDVCASVWRLAATSGFGGLLPADCALLPREVNSAADVGSTVDDPVLPSSPVTDSSIICSENFYIENSTCLPQCDQWSTFSNGATKVLLVTRTLASIIALIGGAAVFVGSIIRYKSMLVYPSVFLVYMTLSFCIVALFVLISSLNRGLFCDSVNLIESVENATTYCQITGVVFQYFFVMTGYWWFFHVCVIFHQLMFPFHARRTRKYHKYFHVFFVLLGILLPLPATVVPFISDQLSYSVNVIPAVLCHVNDRHYIFFTRVLILNILIIISATMFILMFWKAHKYYRQIQNHQSEKGFRAFFFHIGTAERKILFVLTYYILFSITSLLSTGLLLSSSARELIPSLIQENLICEAGGIENNCDRSELDKLTYMYLWLQALDQFLFGLIPVVNLTFVIQWTSACAKLKHWKNTKVFSNTTNTRNIVIFMKSTQSSAEIQKLP